MGNGSIRSGSGLLRFGYLDRLGYISGSISVAPAYSRFGSVRFGSVRFRPLLVGSVSVKRDQIYSVHSGLVLTRSPFASWTFLAKWLALFRLTTKNEGCWLLRCWNHVGFLRDRGSCCWGGSGDSTAGSGIRRQRGRQGFIVMLSFV